MLWQCGVCSIRAKGKACQGRNREDNCRLCSCSLKIKFRKFKHFHSEPFQGLWRISRWQCWKSEIGLEIERSDTSYLVRHACVGMIRNAFELDNFIYLSLQKVKEAMIEVLKQQKDRKHQMTIPLLWSSVIIFLKVGHQWCSLTAE